MEFAERTVPTSGGSEEPDKLYLHAVLVDKSVGTDEAKKMAASVMKKKKFCREKGEAFHFRNIPKTAFEPGSFVAKGINENLTLVFGKLQPGYKN
jgi:hypothetical protein